MSWSSRRAGTDSLISSRRARASRRIFVGDPETTTGLLVAADFAVMPLRRGGGTRIKALEAMAWGVPMIATERAIEGLGLQDGVHFRLAETEAQFIQGVVDLWTDADAYEAQRRAAYRYAWKRFGPDAIGLAVKEGLGRLVQD
jgi:glycosyltransferase involved in cell wall biosynthesis